MKIELRPYQNKGVELLREKMKSGLKRLVLVAPTGAGKTVLFSFMTKSAVDRGKKVLILSDRDELLSQSGGTLQKFNMAPIEISRSKAPKTLNGILYVGMVETISRRLKLPEYKSFLSNIDLIVLDECHKQAFNKIFPFINQDKTVVIGATATPYRDKNMTSMDEFYQSLVEVCKVSELIDSGFLCKPLSYGVPVDLSTVKTKGNDYDSTSLGDMYNETKLFEGVYDNYMKITPGKKTLVFASNIDSSKKLVEDFVTKGLPCRHLDSNMSNKERKEILHWFENSKDAILSNVGILNTGFDCPDIDVVILYRATKSLPLFLQMVGRGSRTTETKKEFTILDFGNNIKTHGFWQEDREWSLKKKKKKKTEGMAPAKECPECNFLLPISTKICECGYEFPVVVDKKEAVFVELRQLTYDQIKNVAKDADFETLENIQIARGYSKGWLYHNLTTEESLIAYAKYKGYKQGWVDHQLQLREQKYA